MTYEVVVDGQTHRLELTPGPESAGGQRTWRCLIDGEEFEVDAVLTARDVMSVLVGNKAYEIKRERSQRGDLHMVLGSARYAVEVRDPRSLRTRRAAAGAQAGPQKLLSPMSGKIVRIAVKEQDEVTAGQSIMVMEAMKMQNELKSPKDGRVARILTAEGSTVNAGDVLAVIE